MLWLPLTPGMKCVSVIYTPLFVVIFGYVQHNSFRQKLRPSGLWHHVLSQ